MDDHQDHQERDAVRSVLAERTSLSVQVVGLVGSVGIVGASLTLCLVRLAVRLTVAGQIAGPVDHRLMQTLSWVVGLIVVCILVVSVAAAAVLRSLIASNVERMHQATSALATGRFTHRIGSRRRDELGRLADGIDAMGERLEQLELTRRRMLAAVSHELRTPLTVIRGHAFTLGRHEADAGRAQTFALIDQESVRLANLVDELLVAATLHASPVVLRPERTAAVSILEHVALRFAAQAREAGVTIGVAADPSVDHRVEVDRERIGQVLANLVANAIAYAPEGSVVELRAERCSGSVRLMVENSGAPIAPDLLARVFEPFVQGEQPTGRVGLGLSIASELVAAHGSRLEIASDARSTRLWFDLATLPERSIATSRIHAQAFDLSGDLS